ncbi:MAG: RNA methyltransferase [Candidatus Diapherotrites archaeon]|nr:RNA methyltransferase [Candidatus Diapherotrites archaeon]
MKQKPKGVVIFKVILIEPEYPQNLGLTCRAMKNFRLSQLVLVNPKAKPSESSAISRSMHGRDVLESAKTVDCIEKALENSDLSVGFTAKSFFEDKILRTPVNLRELSAKLKGKTGSVALVFGRESSGLSNKELKQCDLTCVIPSNPDYATLNISHACAIVFFELFSGGFGKKLPLADKNTKQTIFDSFSDLVSSTKFDFKRPQVMSTAFKRVLNKSLMTQREANVIASVFSRLCEKEKQKNKKNSQ